jgi:hypothetical protein
MAILPLTRTSFTLCGRDWLSRRHQAARDELALWKAEAYTFLRPAVGCSRDGFVVSDQWGGAVEYATLCRISAGRSGPSFYRSGPLPAREIISIRPKARELVAHGLYSRIRNPIYVFGSRSILCLILVLQKTVLWVGLAAVVAIQTIRARREARVLEEAFGDSYREYRRKTWF